MYGKPLYTIEKEIAYKKHIERLNQINSYKHSFNATSNETIEQMHRIRNKSQVYQIKEKKELLEI